ncbi:MAG: SUF system NifU family Fe-S cluster assembly protein [Thermoleophilaceae bacterium]|nr:SUF system NifU family Fe-S cluster assembly protein [Thermoleophilaceae bacterium]
MSDELYRDYILEHYKSPHHFGSLEEHDLEAHDVNPLCGDELKVQLAVDENGVITDIAFEGTGCAISQASASIASDEYIGMKVDDVTKLNHEWIQDLLGIEISPTRKKCAQLNLKVMRGAVTGDATWPDE